MAVPNLSEIATTTIDARSGVVSDNVSNNNPVLTYIKKNGNIKTVDGGDTIVEELSFAENANAGWFSGMDALPVQNSDTISAASFNWKQLAAAVVISGLDRRKNRGEEKILDLLDARMQVAEDTLANFVEKGLFSDGTGYSGKQLTGLDLAVPIAPTSGTYGGINRANYAFWQSQLQTDAGAPTITTIADLLEHLPRLPAGDPAHHRPEQGVARLQVARVPRLRRGARGRHRRRGHRHAGHGVLPQHEVPEAPPARRPAVQLARPGEALQHEPGRDGGPDRLDGEPHLPWRPVPGPHDPQLTERPERTLPWLTRPP
jgi:hypothetical protein